MGFLRLIGWPLVVLLGIFFVGLALGAEESVEHLVKRPATQFGLGALIAALLVADVFLPIPSSLVMIAAGSGFGFWGGGALSTVSYGAGTLIGYWTGRAFCLNDSQPPLERSNLLAALAVIVSRPIPLLSESVSLAAGRARMPIGPFCVSAFVGSAPLSYAMAFVGASSNSLPVSIVASTYLALVGVFVLFMWLRTKAAKQRDPQYDLKHGA